ncbi:DUF456 domain-containing protein [Zeaxanthinibacter enoshimensis]|uniref:DUF456 domain-containing protein n=1 Tax=Zeaxanthinibacter enoshimensis TaxID=392009 RepID=A0A4R6TQH8_9FLAO|nr:DUF456 domain-containing protein [Zeaxanthinibacter enoshimensis]TDQ32373.1 hypothetical protein CLV82_0200 [Zeaxanthinibacter enoshimensis]
MDTLLLILGFLLILGGIAGSFLPVLPGPPLGWVGLLVLSLTKAIPADWWLLSITGIVALAVFIIDYAIPVMGTRRFGGSRAGMIGTTIGLLVSIFFPVLGIFGIVIWPFAGALVGELLNKADRKTAFKAAFGSFLGFLTGTFLKFVVCVVFLGLYISKAWEHREALFPYFFS